MIGVGVGPEEGQGALVVPGGLGDKAGPGVAEPASVELRPSVVTTWVATAWTLTEAQQSRSTSRRGDKPRGPIARLNPTRPALRTLRCRATAATARQTSREESREAARNRAVGGERAGMVPRGGDWGGTGDSVRPAEAEEIVNAGGGSRAEGGACFSKCRFPDSISRYSDSVSLEQGPGISVFNKCPDATGGRGGDRNLGTRLL